MIDRPKEIPQEVNIDLFDLDDSSDDLELFEVDEFDELELFKDDYGNN